MGTTLKRISKELAERLSDQADKESVLQERKVTTVELIEKYCEAGLKKDKKKLLITKSK